MNTPVRKLDDDIRDACAALDRAVPDDYFDTLGGRIEARLDSADLEGEAMGPNMTTDGGKKNDMPPPAGQPAAKREENTGLHDIKAMATSTKKRISRRMSTESDHEESLLASASSASLAAVVLPEPGKDKEHYADEGSVTPRAAAASAVGLTAAETERSSGMPLWIYGVAGAAVAAAAIIFFVVRSGHEKTTEVAQSEAATGTAAAAPQPEETPATAPTASSIPEPAADQAGDKDVAPPAEDPNGSETPADQGSSADTDLQASNAATPPPAAPVPAKQDNAERRSSRSRHSSSHASSSSSSKSSASRAAAPRATSHTSKSKPKSSDGKRSLDDLLNEASGGAVANSDVAAADKPAEAKKAPSKTELSRSDITTGMRKISGRVSACYGKFQEAGTVMVKVTIAADGHVSSASATGKFKNTETGLCVSQAVEKAKFPAWDGKDRHINYPFLLSP